MGYPEPLTGVSRLVTKNIVTFSTGFTRADRLQFGARMTLIKTAPSSFTIYSTIPHSKDVVSKLDEFLVEKGLLNAGQSFQSQVTSIVIPDKEHTMALEGWYKALNGKVQVVGPPEVSPEIQKLVTCSIPAGESYKTISGEDLVKFGLSKEDPLASNDFKLMFFPGHANSELVLLDAKAKTLMEGDLFFNFQLNNKKNPNCDLFNEQFNGKDPHSGIWGWVTRKAFSDGHSFLNGLLMKAVFKDRAGVKKGVDAMVSDWEFDKIIPCHGDTVDRNGVKVWKEAFEFLG